jgi:hypothetical protein
MKTQQSITRSLVEIKTLDSRIGKIIDASAFTSYKTKSRNFGLNAEEFRKSALADFQSINDLITRRDSIKNAIVLSNSTTIVSIAEKQMTVSQAIEFKNTIGYKELLLQKLKTQRQMVTVESELHRNRVQTKVDDNIRIICGKDVKADASSIQTITDGITKGDPIEIFDPLGIDKVIDALETEIEDFRANVDFVLSESNALTKISV